MAQQLLLLLSPSRTFSNPPLASSSSSSSSSLPCLRFSPPAACPPPPAHAAAGRWRLAGAARGGLLPCGMGRSDLISDLELAKPEGKQQSTRRSNGIFWILLLNLGLYVADHLFQIRQIKALYLYHAWPTWYQFVTSIFCHANWNHLSSNLFFVYIFGKLVEEEEGTLALWLAYILTGAGANLISWLFLPSSSVSLGASGAVFGLFTISVLVKMSWDWRKIIEVLILGQFVFDKVMEAAQASTVAPGYSLQVNSIAHLSGALIGAALVFLTSQIPSPPWGGLGSGTLKERKEKRS